MDILRPFLLLACAAFTVGFVGYWSLVGALAPSVSYEQTPWPAQIAAPSPDLSAPALQGGKHI